VKPCGEFSEVRVCKRCGILYTNGNYKYCSSDCKTAVKNDYNKEYMKKRIAHGTICGTGLLGSHRNPDFETELKLITNEKRRLLNSRVNNSHLVATNKNYPTKWKQENSFYP
jgi:hypothetical protein